VTPSAGKSGTTKHSKADIESIYFEVPPQQNSISRNALIEDGCFCSGFVLKTISTKWYLGRTNLSIQPTSVMRIDNWAFTPE